MDNFRASYRAWKYCCPKCDYYGMYDLRIVRFLRREITIGTRLRIVTF